MPRVWDELGIDNEDYEDLCAAGGGVCWICARDQSDGRRLAVDHDHRTGAVRGLLCASCNRRLGGTLDPEWLRRAAEYLEVAARAFGDSCNTCDRPAPSQLVMSDGNKSVFEHRCCGKRWKVAYSTRGVPASWNLSGIPAPPERDGLTTDPASIGYPRSEDET